MNRVFITACVITCLLFGLIGCSSSNKDSEIDNGSGDSTLITIKSQIRPQEDPRNYSAIFSLFPSARVHVSIINMDNNTSAFEHDYFQMPDNSKADQNSVSPPSFYWLDDRHILMEYWRNYPGLNFVCYLWSIIDINKSSQADILIRTGEQTDTTYCSFPTLWYKHCILATMTINGTNKAVVFDGELKTQYATDIASEDPSQLYLYEKEIIPISYSDYINYKSFPAVVTRSGIDGTDKWKTSFTPPYQMIIRNLKNQKLELVNVTTNETTLQFNTQGQTNAGNDTTVIFKLNLETGEAL